jgi:hypothetical protein
MSFLMARLAEADQILGRVNAEAAPRLNVVDLEIFHPPARLATPAVSLQIFPAKMAICFRVKPHGRTSENPICIYSKSTSLSDLVHGLMKGMPTASSLFTNSTTCAKML